MRVVFWVDPGTGEPHIYEHGVTEQEVVEALGSGGVERSGREGTKLKVGKTLGGRWLKVVFLREEESRIFVITAFEPTSGEVQALRRRIKRKR